ncbi:P27 family phage terminase small subunit [Rhodococcus sp. H29-C3]|uniref:P27 family phage terminase small subunit n=1 Tax=Rhodococcus sp. H29-C3 TaxID=3046307 RepID=UPI0024B94874|nr:P27 family phage terminase small subunit [Rhodococcus sp. H29-C3]MDJ0361542.1 P27 family phage terminase small subunit [Rhodococcus sp. H29-C3]
MPAKKPYELRLLTARHEGVDSAGRAMPNPRVERHEPDKPADLTAEASLEWDRIIESIGHWLKIGDRAALVNLCETWSELVRLRKYLRKNGFKQRVTVRDAAGAVTALYRERPEVKLYRGFLVEHRLMTSTFGLNPVSEGAASRGSAPTEDALDGVPNPFAGQS